MTFVCTDSTDPVCDALTQWIGDRLQNDTPVLFLVSGGSTAAIAVDTCKALQVRFDSSPDTLKRLLTVSLIDERFGYQGHPDSNWRLLLENGLQSGYWLTMPLLENSTGSEVELDILTKRFDAFLTEAAVESEQGKIFIVGLLGIGTDGHTAGILPNSPASALAVTANNGWSRVPLATAYKTAFFSRITITPAFFQYIDFAVVYAAGSAKWPVLAELKKDKPVADQPAQLLKLAKKTLIFSDKIPGQLGAIE